MQYPCPPLIKYIGHDSHESHQRKLEVAAAARAEVSGVDMYHPQSQGLQPFIRN